MKFRLKINPRTLRILIISIVVMFLFFVFFLTLKNLFKPVFSIFNVAANTERIELTVAEKPQSRLNFNEASFPFLFPKKPDTVLSGSIKIQTDTKIIFERISNGPLWITLKREDAKSLGEIYSPAEDLILRLGSSLDILIDSIEYKSQIGETFLFPLNGTVELGREIGFETFGTTSVLRAGEVTLTTSSISNVFGERDYFIGRKMNLDMGDNFMLEKPLSNSVGFIRVDERPAIHVNYQVLGREGIILKAGPSRKGISVRASVVDKFINDSFFYLISIIVGCITFILAIISFYLDVENFKSEKHKD